jgi:hypothetical protein
MEITRQMIGIENLALLIANGAVSGSSVHLSPGNAAKVTGKSIKQAKAEIENTVLKTGQFQFLRISDLARQEVAA